MPQLWGIIGGVLVLQVGVMVGVAALTRAAGSHPNDALTAVIVAVVGTMSICVLVGLAVVFSGGASWLVGGEAERWTGDALQRLGPDWRFSHNVEFTIGETPYSYTMDVDHVGVGPSGVLVIETKYSSEQIDLDAEKLASKICKAADRASQNANRIRHLFATMPVTPQVTALVIYWGFRPVMPKEPIRHLGSKGQTLIVMGPDIDRWIDVVTAGHCESNITDEAWRRIEEFQAANASSPVATP
jgi:hypothetical protein